MHIKNIAIYVVVFFFTIIILELFLQLGSVGVLSDNVTDTKLGNALKPNYQFVYFNEGFSVGKINDFGYYGPAYPRINKNKERICLLGDSYVEGIQVFERNHFRNILENELNNSNSIKYEVLNFGRSGFNLNNVYCYYNLFVKEFNPTKSIVFISASDLLNNETSKLLPFAEKINDSIYINNDFIDYPPFKYKQATEAFRGKSIILGFISKCITIIKSGEYKEIVFEKLTPSNNKDVIKDIDKSIKMTDLTKSIIMELSNQNCVFVIHRETTTNTYDYLIDEFVTYAQNINIEVVDLSPLFESLKKNEINFNHWGKSKKKGHFNQQGHKEIANYLYNYLISKK